MTAAGPLVFPGSRVLAGWWQQLAPLHPQTLWVGHLLLHSIEALVWANRPRSLDRFAQLVLRALSLDPEQTVSALNGLLHLGQQVVRQVLHRLQKEGLVQTTAGGGWQPTALGRHALAHNTYLTLAHERRRFCFVESSRAGHPPCFLALAAHAGAPCSPPSDWNFEVGVLQTCIGQAVEWKHRRGFPQDVEGLLPLSAEPAQPEHNNHAPGVESTPPPDEASAIPSLPYPTPLPEPPAWQRVVLDRPEQMLTALVWTGEDSLLGFAARQEGWALQGGDPIFRLHSDWREVFPELAAEPPPESWRQAWRIWAQQRQLPVTEAEACVLEPQGLRLRVSGPKRLVERARGTVREEVWLLAGEGRIRSAALLELAESVP